MKYDLEAIKAKLNTLSATKKGSGDEGSSKITWWKATPGSHSVRFIPLSNADGTPHAQPFFEVVYYDDKGFAERRFVAPSQWGMPDPVQAYSLELSKNKKEKADWLKWKRTQPKERYYAPVFVRGEEEKGVQVWELSPKLCKDVYALLVSPDYAEEDMFSVEKGFDFTVTVTPTDKTFNGYVINDVKLLPRRKASELAPKKEQVKALLATVPNFEAFFKSQVKGIEELTAMIESFDSYNAEEKVGEKTPQGTSRGTLQDNAKVAADVNDAFADLENS